MTMAGSITLNDTLLWRDASLQEPLSRSWNQPRYWLLPQTALVTGENTLWFRITGMAQDTLGLGRVELGEPAAVWPVYRQQVWQQRHLFTLNSSISLVLGCLFLTLWAMRRTETAFGWYALSSLSWAVFAGTMLATSPWPFADSADWNRWVSTVLVIYTSSFCLFTWHFGQQSFPRLARALGGTALAAVALLWWVPLAGLNAVLVSVFVGFSLIFMLNCIQFQWHAWHHRQRHTLLLALCLLFFLAVSLHDLLVAAGVMGGDRLFAPFTSPASMIVMSLIIADRFARNLGRIESFNAELQAAVDNTRTELTRTLQREHRLEAHNIRLTERLKLSHDLHDSLGNALMRSMATVEQAAVPIGNPRFLSMLKELRDDLRQIIDNSSPTATTENTTPAEWIAPLRHRFVRLFDELGIESSWKLPVAWPCPLSSMQLLALSRFLEEALSNAIKHSRGSRLDVFMQASDGGLLLQVSDNGIGFDVDAARNGPGIGMSSMQARILRIGGQLDIQSQPGDTRLRVRLQF